MQRALWPLLGVALAMGCRKKAPEVAAVDVDPVDVGLQIAAMSPSTVPSGKLVSGTVVGSG